MSENILSLEDLKFLEVLYSNFGLQFLRFDEAGFQVNNEEQIVKGTENEPFANISYLKEISKKLRFRLDSNFQLNFSQGFNFDLQKI